MVAAIIRVGIRPMRWMTHWVQIHRWRRRGCMQGLIRPRFEARSANPSAAPPTAAHVQEPCEAGEYDEANAPNEPRPISEESILSLLIAADRGVLLLGRREEGVRVVTHHICTIELCHDKILVRHTGICHGEYGSLWLPGFAVHKIAKFDVGVCIPYCEVDVSVGWKGSRN